MELKLQARKKNDANKYKEQCIASSNTHKTEGKEILDKSQWHAVNPQAIISRSTSNKNKNKQ